VHGGLDKNICRDEHVCFGSRKNGVRAIAITADHDSTEKKQRDTVMRPMPWKPVNRGGFGVTDLLVVTFEPLAARMPSENRPHPLMARNLPMLIKLAMS